MHTERGLHARWRIFTDKTVNMWAVDELLGMRLLCALFICLTVCLPTVGQSLVTFQTLPLDLQLYARDGANQALVVVEGTLTDATVQKVACLLRRNGKLVQQQRITLANARTFRFAPTIRAELAEYSIQLYAYRATGDSVLLAERKRLLCGDAFVIYGQSNAIGDVSQVQVDDKYMRQCGFPPAGADPNAIQIQWYSATQPYASVGAFGLSMAEAMMAVTNVPVCLINGAEGGANLGQLTDRNPNKPTDLTTFYGRLLYRTRWAGFQGQVKALFFKQGEAEAGSSVADYPASFDRLYRLLRQDYGNGPIFYVSQINIMGAGQPNVGELRDFQRRLKTIYPVGLENIATVGTPGYDGVHYSLNGNRQIAREQARQVLRDVYGLADTLQINSPNIRKVVQNSRNDTLTLVFDPEMQMTWSADSVLDHGNGRYTRRLIDVFYPNGQTGQVSAGRAAGNRVQIALKQPAVVQTLTYLPPYFSDAQNSFYDGPVLKNGRGMRAFSFNNVPVGRALPAVTNLALVPNATTREMVLSWALPTPAATNVVLERAIVGAGLFTIIATISANVTTYRDLPPASVQGRYQYRLRVANQLSESGLSNVVEGRLPIICTLAVSLGTNTTVAGGTPVVLQATVTGALLSVDSVTIRWSGPGTNQRLGSPLSVSGLAAASANVYTVTAVQGICSATATTTVTVLPPCTLSVVIAGEQTIPFGGTLSLSAVVSGAQAGTGPITARWNGPAGYTATSVTINQTGLTPGLSGTYSLTVEQGRCTASTVAAVLIQPPLAVEEPAAYICISPNPVRAGQPIWLRMATGGIPTGVIHLTVYTLTGQRILNRSLTPASQTELLISSLPAGLYLLDLTNGAGKVAQQRLLVE